jgi:MerR-like DNA binding protein
LATGHSILDLVSIVGSNRISVRRIQRWISRGIVDRPLGGRGRGAYYTDKHVRQINYVLGKLEDNRTLDDLRDQLHPVEDDNDDFGSYGAG